MQDMGHGSIALLSAPQGSTLNLAITAGIIGGVAFLIALGICLCRARRRHKAAALTARRRKSLQRRETSEVAPISEASRV